MGDTTTRELQIRLTAVDAGATGVVAKVSGDVRKEIAELDAKARNAAQAKRYTTQDYKSQFREATAGLKRDEAGTIQKYTETPAQRSARDAAEAAAAEAKTTADFEIKALRQKRLALAESLKSARLENVQRQAGQLGDINAEERLRFRNTAAIEAARRNSAGTGQGAGSPDGAGGVIGQLKGGFGRNSTFTQFGKIAQGGGAILGLGLAARELDEFTKKAVELRNEFHNGAKSGGEIADELARSIPVLGSIFAAGQSIRELFSAEAAAAKQITDEAEATNLTITARGALLAVQREDYEKSYEASRRIRAEIALIGSTGAKRSIGQSENAHDAFVADAQKEAREKIAKLDQDPAFLAAKNALQAELAKAIPQRNFNALLGHSTNEAEISAALGSHSSASNHYFALVKQKEDLKKQIEQNSTAAISDDAVKAGAEQRESLLEQGRKFGEEAIAQSRELAQRQAAVNLENARLSGHLPEAQIADIERERAEKVAEIQERARKEIDEKRRSGVDGRSAAGKEILDDIGRRADAEIAAEKEIARQRTGEAGHQGEVADQQAVNALRRQRLETIEAELAGEDHLHEIEKQRLEIEQQFAERRQQLSEEIRTAVASRREELQLVLDSLDAQERTSQEARVTNTLIEDRLQSLREQARYGDESAKAEVERADAAERYRKEVERLQGIIASEGGSAAGQEAARRLAAIPDREHARVGKGLEDATLKLAREAGQGGDRATSRLAAQIEAAKQFREIKAELESVIKDVGSTAAQKGSARELLKSLPLAAKQAVDAAGANREALPLSASTTENHFVRSFYGIDKSNTGAAQKAKEEAFIRDGKNRQDHTALLNTMSDTLAKILNALVGSNPVNFHF